MKTVTAVLLLWESAEGVGWLITEVSDKMKPQMLVPSSYGTGTSTRLSPALVNGSDIASPGDVYVESACWSTGAEGDTAGASLDSQPGVATAMLNSLDVDDALEGKVGSRPLYIELSIAASESASRILGRPRLEYAAQEPQIITNVLSRHLKSAWRRDLHPAARLTVFQV